MKTAEAYAKKYLNREISEIQESERNNELSELTIYEKAMVQFKVLDVSNRNTFTISMEEISMETIEEIEQNNKIHKHEFDTISNMMFESFLITSYQQNISTVIKQNELLDHFRLFLKKYLQLQFFNSTQDKLAVMDFIDKLNLQKELLELKTDNTNLADIQIAAQRLGKKSQSAFETK